MLLEAYCQESGICFHKVSSAMPGQALKRRGLEPDECYYLGSQKEFPDLSVEIVLGSRLIDKPELGLILIKNWLYRAISEV